MTSLMLWARVGMILGVGLGLGCTSLETTSSSSGGSPGAMTSSKKYPNQVSFLPTKESDVKESYKDYEARSQADYNFSIGEAYSLEGNSPKAVEAFKSVLALEPNSTTVRLRLVTELLRSNQFSEALLHATLAVKSDPKNVQARILLGGLYSSMRIFPKAVEQYLAVLQDNPKNQEAPIYLGAVYGEMKEYDKSVQFFESMAKNSDYSAVHLPPYYIGRVRMEQGGEKNFKDSEKNLLKSIQAKPDFAESTISLAALYEKWGRTKEILPVLQKYQKSYGPHTKVAEILAQTYIENQKLDEAYEQLEYLESQTDDSISIKMRMALILIEKKIYPEAAKRLEQVLELAPDSDKVRYYLGAVYEEMNEVDKAVSNFVKVPTASSFYQDAILHAVYLEKKRGDLNAALSLVQKALFEKEENAAFHTLNISLLDESKDFKKAEKAAKVAVDKFPENAQVHFFSGVISDRLGQRDHMIRDMTKVVELDPNHVQALNYLAFSWADAKENLEQAEKMGKRALELEPTDGYIIDTLGWVYFQRGNLREALRYLEIAHKYQPQVPIIAEHLGDVYAKQALTEKALDMYHKAIELESDKERISHLRQKISLIADQQGAPFRRPAAADSTPQQNREK